ncbi:molybdopterin-dependent oxidoreductase [Oscillatoria salina]|uniref:molybdopterin-dependent oxidoreductase n=1 Tax=Oscillatoria salina TaxID=331517 RepID=UPI001CCC68CC|nr:molybdopterin-dependent oxidoreductase [Oscillatoria salina]MBZ8180172.1 molybdopterin-dependent oxidoreductase [Oscillatoria salina IIICB1]
MKNNLGVFAVLALLTSCSSGYSEAELTQLHEEAIAANAILMKNLNQNQQFELWQLLVQGEINYQKTVSLSLAQLKDLETISVVTSDPHNSLNANSSYEFRGVKVATLLDRYGVDADVTEVTFVAYDGYRATVSWADLQKYPIIVAFERDRRPIARSDGGPLYLVFPYTDYPQLQQKYGDRYWVFYLTHAIAGTPDLGLQVGDRKFNARSLAKFPQVTIEEAVGYSGWSPGKVQLHGVRLRDVFQAAKVESEETVIIQGKSIVHRNPYKPIEIPVAAVQGCDVLLITAWGKKRQPIPSRMGGPLTLAFSPDCQEFFPQNPPWLTFVEQILVE